MKVYFNATLERQIVISIVQSFSLTAPLVASSGLSILPYTQQHLLTRKKYFEMLCKSRSYSEKHRTVFTLML